MAQTIETILQERNSTHGSFADNARVSQGLKRFIHEQSGWQSLPEVQREAIDMICLKLSRILSGRSDEPDHFLDISGYAMLAHNDMIAEK